MPKTKEEMRLMLDVSEEILNVTEAVGEVTFGDLQGIAEATAVEIIKIVRNAKI